jgi:hypothetical protein
MADEERPGAHGTPGIRWEPGDEDYPFPSIPGETALDFLGRWLDRAEYARLERDGVRYVHEVDLANLVNHLTADVSLLMARLETFGDRVVTAETYDSTVERLERALGEIDGVLADLRRGRA